MLNNLKNCCIRHLKKKVLKDDEEEEEVVSIIFNLLK